MLRSVNPATGEVIATRAELTPEAIEAKIALATSAFGTWRRTGLDARAALLERVADRYDANRDRLARMASDEMGKTLKAAGAEVDKCAAGFRFYAREGAAMLAPRRVAIGGGTVEERWLPMGPVLAVMPWNFPYWQAVRFLAPTIMAGNTGLLKHASAVQGCAMLMEEMALAAGAPEGLFQNLAIGARAVGAIIDDPRIVAVTLTGSEGAGVAVAERAGRNLKPVILELGGSDPFVVMPSADLDKAVAAAVTGRVQNSGQSCICAKRMIIHTDVYDAFLERFVAAMAAVKAGDPADPASDMGPLSSAEQRDAVLGQVAAAQAAGARLLAGGAALPGPGAFMSAGVLVDLAPDHPLASEEVFGPVAMVFRADGIDAAIALANAVPFGLGSSVWTRDAAEQERFATEIEAGMTAVNQVLASTPEAAFGGVKRSGHGRELGAFGLHAFMNLKSVFLPAEPRVPAPAQGAE